MANKDKKKQWEIAYSDYREGMQQADIAKKYNVSLATVKSWYTRHWKAIKIDEKNNAWKKDIVIEEMHNPASNGLEPLIDMTKGYVKDQYKGIVAKQIKETNAQEIYNSYNKYNLPILEDREARFVEEYLVDYSKTQAAIRAGYSVDTAPELGCKIYNKPDVYAHIQVAIAERRRRTGVNIDRTLQEMACIAYCNPMNAIDNDGNVKADAREEDLRAIASVKVKRSIARSGGEIVEREVKFIDKNKALEAIARHQGMFIDRKLVLNSNVDDLSKLSTEELERELAKQQELANTIDITKDSTVTIDNNNDDE